MRPNGDENGDEKGEANGSGERGRRLPASTRTRIGAAGAYPGTAIPGITSSPTARGCSWYTHSVVRVICMLTIEVCETRWLLSTANPARSGIAGSPPRSSGTETVRVSVSSIPMWSASTLASAAS